MKCFYHDDLDGKAAAFCVWTWVGILPLPDGTYLGSEFIPINYGMKFPLETIHTEEQIWILDYSILPDEMLKLLAITDEVTWIDHHKTAIEKYVDFLRPIRGIRKNGEAGCVLTWKYIHWYTARGSGLEDFTKERSKELPIPRCILLTGDRDIWSWKYGDETKNFYAGSQLYNTSPDSQFWLDCMAHEIEDVSNTGNAKERERGSKFWQELLFQGQTVERFKQQFYKDLAVSIGYETIFENYHCFAINVARISSDIFSDVMDKYEIFLPYYHDGKQWTISLYTTKDIDVSEIAKKYDGGGHKQASGFQCKKLPWQ